MKYPNRRIRSLTGGLAFAALCLPSLQAQQDVNWTRTDLVNPDVARWSEGTNWSTSPLVPADGDNVFFGNPQIPIAGIINIDTAPVVGTLNISNTTALTFAGIDEARTLTINNGINLTGESVTHVLSNFAGTGLGLQLGGNNVWNLAQAGSGFSGGLNVGSPISDGGSGYGIIKTGVKPLNLVGNNTFSGGIIQRQGNITVTGTGAAAENTQLGTGTYTFANEVGGLNVSLAFNSPVSKTIENDFVLNNAAVVVSPPGTQYAQISYFGGVTGNRVLTLNGDFSTGPNVDPSQGIFFSVNSNNNTGVDEGSVFLNGNWSNYVTTSGAAVRVGGGSTVINAQSAVMGGTGGYILLNANLTAGLNGSKLIVNGAFDMTRSVTFSGAGGANTAFAVRNSFGSRNAVGTAATVTGTINVAAANGGNVFSQNEGANLNVGPIFGTTRLKINDGYTFTEADSVNTLQLPTGTVNLVRDIGNANLTGPIDVMRGALLANNLTGTATGTGAITVGAASTGGSGLETTYLVNSRSLNGIDTAVAQTLIVGQPVSGTGIPEGAVVTGIAVGSGPNNSSIGISLPTTEALTITNLAFGAYSTTAKIGGTGRIAPTGTNGITVNSGSQVGVADGIAETLEIDMVGTAGNVEFLAGAVFEFELGNPGISDTIVFTGLADSLVNFSNNTVNIIDLGGVGIGSYTLFTFDLGSNYTTNSLVLGTRPAGVEGTFDYSVPGVISLNLTAVPEPTVIAGLLCAAAVFGVTRLRRKS